MSAHCVIFDLDGTLVDSERLSGRAFRELLPQLTETVDELVRRYRGTKLALILADLERRLECRLAADFEQVYRAHVADLFTRELRLMPGVREMLESLALTPKCIASSAPFVKIEQAVRVTRIGQHFGERIYSAYEVGSWKPEPGLFLHAARAMGFAPDACVVIEDSDVGVRGALAAGMRVFRYAPDEIHSEVAGEIPFQDMSQLPQLIADWAGGGRKVAR